MTFYWEKLGRLFNPEEHRVSPLLLTHAANPLPVHLYSDIFRIFYNGRDFFNRSSIGAIDINIVTRELVGIANSPFVSPADASTHFCRDGISIASTYCIENNHYMVFMGWDNRPGRHWRGHIGRFKILNSNKFILDPAQPLINIDQYDPVSLSYPWIQQSPKGGYDMWYGSTISWDSVNGEMIHVIKHASSTDGHHWIKHGLALPYKIGKAQAFSHPTVLANSDGSLMMWFSYRSGSGEKYRIGLATSADGYSWELDLHNSGITTSDCGWDSK